MNCLWIPLLTAKFFATGDSRQNVPGYPGGGGGRDPLTNHKPYGGGGGEPLSNHKLYAGSDLYPGMYFPPESGQPKNPFNYDFTIGIGP